MQSGVVRRMLPSHIIKITENIKPRIDKDGTERIQVEVKQGFHPKLASILDDLGLNLSLLEFPPIK